MSQGIGGGQCGQGKRRTDRLLQSARIAQSANQPMVRLNISGVQINRGTKCLRRLSRRTRSEKVDPSLAVPFGELCIGCIHGFL